MKQNFNYKFFLNGKMNQLCVCISFLMISCVFNKLSSVSNGLCFWGNLLEFSAWQEATLVQNLAAYYIFKIIAELNALEENGVYVFTVFCCCWWCYSNWVIQTDYYNSSTIGIHRKLKRATLSVCQWKNCVFFSFHTKTKTEKCKQ